MGYYEQHATSRTINLYKYHHLLFTTHPKDRSGLTHAQRQYNLKKKKKATLILLAISCLKLPKG